MREAREPKGILGAVLAIVIAASLIYGGYYAKKAMDRKHREAELAKVREERKMNADPAKMLRDSERMQELNRQRVQQQCEQAEKKP